ncbi:MAG: PAS domain S-box protein [Myxococcales bacterium]|nr:PAS domain S-box protein [Myxococcales bacterium]
MGRPSATPALSKARILGLYRSAAVREALAAELSGPGLQLQQLDETTALAPYGPSDVVIFELCDAAAPALATLGELRSIALLSEATAQAWARAAALGAFDTVLLPLRPGELSARVGRCLAEQARRRDGEVLLELTRTLVSSIDFQEILYTLVSRVAEVVAVDRVSIVLVPDAGDVGYVVAASDDARLSNLQLQLEKYPEIRHALSTRRSLTIEDVGSHPLLDEVRSSVTHSGLSALTLVPIVWEDESMGVLFVRSRSQSGALDDDQLEFCEVLTNATAIALRNARLLQSLRDESQRDLYARIEAEKRLSSLRQYADLLASAADGLTAFDADGRLLFANPSAEKLLDCSAADYLGRFMTEFFAPEDNQTFMALRRRLASGDYPHDVDLPVRRPDGKAMMINGSFAPLAGTEGAILLSFRDVTNDRATRNELVRTRNFLQSLIEASVDAIVAARTDGTIVLFNEGARRLYGYDPKEVIGKMNVRALYPGDGALEVGRMLFSNAHGGKDRLEPVRIEAIDSRGTIFPISLTAASILEDGERTATFGIFTDLRDRVRVEQQLAHAQEQLQVNEKQALVAELAGATAHELNQPLTSVMGYSELLLKKLPSDSPTYRAADRIHSETTRMAEIVRKIGRLTRYETKSYVGEQKILDLDRASEDD